MLVLQMPMIVRMTFSESVPNRWAQVVVRSFMLSSSLQFQEGVSGMRISRFPRLLGALSLLAGLQFAATAGAQTVARIESIDPLKAAPPEPSLALRFASDDTRPEQRVLSSLWAKAAAAAPGESLDVIITLHEPEAPYNLAATGGDDHLRTQWVSALEHQFVAKARNLGLSDSQGLSHFPIVFGKIAPKDLLDLAMLREVATIEEVREVSGSRVQGAALMHADQLRTQFGGAGAGIDVAVIDSGVDASHPELFSRVTVQGNYTPDPGDGTNDGAGHGTSVAGIIAGTMGGMAPQSHIWAIKVLDSAGQGMDPWILNGLNAAYASRNDFGGLDVINMSLGGGGPFNTDCDALFPSYAMIIGQLKAAGIPTFVASGNSGYLNGVSEPACLSNVISVGAVYDANVGARGPFVTPGYPGGTCLDASTQADQITCYSNSGLPLDILAPADCATTTAPGGGYNPCFDGTSAASPYASGVAAQILSLRPGTTPQQLYTALTTTGRARPDVNGITRNRIDAVAAYQALGGGGSTQPCSPSDTTLCVDDNLGDQRFEVKIQYQNSQASGSAHAIPLSSLGVTQGGLFWIGRVGNPEVLIKVLNACVPPFNHYWVFYAATTNQGLVTTVRDTHSGSVWTRTNPLGTAAIPVQDTGAFPCD
jgi:Subtilase family